MEQWGTRSTIPHLMKMSEKGKRLRPLGQWRHDAKIWAPGSVLSADPASHPILQRQPPHTRRAGEEGQRPAPEARLPSNPQRPSALLHRGYGMQVATPAFNMSVGDLNSGPNRCAASSCLCSVSISPAICGMPCPWGPRREHAPPESIHVMTSWQETSY